MKILCIEDEEGIAEIVQMGLEAADYSVELAHDGPSGLERAIKGGWSATDLSQRLAVSGKDEFVRLTTTFNAMLVRLENAFERQREVEKVIRARGGRGGADEPPGAEPPAPRPKRLRRGRGRARTAARASAFRSASPSLALTAAPWKFRAEKARERP